MGATPIYNLRYLNDDDPPDIPLDGENSMTDVEAELERIDAAIAGIWGGAVSMMASESTDQLNVASTSYAAGTPACETSFKVPPSGKVWVAVAGHAQGELTSRIFVSFEIRTATGGAGSVAYAATDANAFVGDFASAGQASGPRTLVTGLTPGVTYWARTMHKSLGGGTGDIFDRRITVQPTV